MDVKTISFPVPDPGADDKKLFVLKAPVDSKGGGITITEAYAVNNATFAGAGTTFTLQLLTYSNAGTPAVNGTVSNILGSASPWTADVPQQFTVSDGWVDGGEWVVLDYQEITAGNPTNCYVTLSYVQGRG